MIETYYLSGKDYTHAYAFGASARESYKLIKCEEDNEGHLTFYDYTHTELVLSKNDFDTDIKLGLLHKIPVSTWMRLKDLCCAMMRSLDIEPLSASDYTSDMARRIIQNLNISADLCQAYEAECKAVLYRQAMFTSHFIESPKTKEIDELRNLIDSALKRMLSVQNKEKLISITSALSTGFKQYAKLNLNRIRDRGV